MSLFFRFFLFGRLSASLLFLLVLALFFTSSALAQTTDTPTTATDGGLRLTTSPLPINLVTEPGKTITTELKVKNAGSQPETLKIELMKFKAYEETGKPQLLEREPGDDFLDWVTFSEPTFTVAPDEWRVITATFQVPPTAAFGYYYVFVFSRANEEQQLGERETALVGGTAVLVLLEARVADAKREVTVTEFSTDKKFYEFLPATFNVKLKNTGNVHIAPRGNVFIDQGNTKDIAILEVNGNKGNILPNSSRVFDTVWEDGFPVYVPTVQDDKVIHDAEGNVVYKLQWDWNDASKLRFGKYTAKLLLIYDDGARDIPIEGEVSFWVVPWRLIGVVIFNFALILALILYVIRLRKRLKKMKGNNNV